MAVSVSTGTTAGRSQFVLGDRRATIIDVTFDSSYPTNGESLVLTPYVQGPIAAVFASVKTNLEANEANVVAAVYDRVNSKILLFNRAAGDAADLQEVANTTDLTGCVVTLFIIGE